MGVQKQSRSPDTGLTGSLPMNKLQTKPLLRSFLTFQGTNQLVSQLRQVLLVHLQTEFSGSFIQTGRQMICDCFVFWSPGGHNWSGLPVRCPSQAPGRPTSPNLTHHCWSRRNPLKTPTRKMFTSLDLSTIVSKLLSTFRLRRVTNRKSASRVGNLWLIRNVAANFGPTETQRLKFIKVQSSLSSDHKTGIRYPPSFF